MITTIKSSPGDTRPSRASRLKGNPAQSKKAQGLVLLHTFFIHRRPCCCTVRGCTVSRPAAPRSLRSYQLLLSNRERSLIIVGPCACLQSSVAQL